MKSWVFERNERSRVTWALVGGILFEREEVLDPRFSCWVLKSRPKILARDISEVEAEELVAARKKELKGGEA